MLEGCYRGIAGILKGVPKVLHGCYMGVLKGVIGGLYGCYRHSKELYREVTGVL